VQRRDNELTSETHDLVDKTLQSPAIELRCWIVEQQCWSHLADLLQEPQLGDCHRHRHQFLLAAGKHVPCGASVETHGDICTNVVPVDLIVAWSLEHWGGRCYLEPAR